MLADQLDTTVPDFYNSYVRRTAHDHQEHLDNLRELCRQAEEMQQGSSELVDTLNRHLDETRARHQQHSARQIQERRKRPRS